MFRAALPDVPNLFVCASVSVLDGNWISATGIGETPDEATVRHDSERAERRYLVRNGQVGRPVHSMAAGRDAPDRIAKRAANELVERWLCNGWWAGHVRHARPSREAQAAFESALGAWPRENPRRTGLRQLAAPGFPAVCIAWSCDAAGRSLCFGMACADQAESAARRALFELYQMEFGLSVVRHRARNGVALSDRERWVLDRAKRLSFAAVADRLTDGAGHDPARGKDCGAVAGLEIDFETGREGDHRIVLARLQSIDAASWPSGTSPGWSLYGDG